MGIKNFKFQEIMDKAHILGDLTESFHSEEIIGWWTKLGDKAYRTLENDEFAHVIATICDEKIKVIMLGEFLIFIR